MSRKLLMPLALCLLALCACTTQVPQACLLPEAPASLMTPPRELRSLPSPTPSSTTTPTATPTPSS